MEVSPTGTVQGTKIFYWPEWKHLITPIPPPSLTLLQIKSAPLVQPRSYVSAVSPPLTWQMVMLHCFSHCFFCDDTNRNVWERSKDSCSIGTWILWKAANEKVSWWGKLLDYCYVSLYPVGATILWPIFNYRLLKVSHFQIWEVKLPVYKVLAQYQ